MGKNIKEIICRYCNKLKLHKAKSLCVSCYDKNLKTLNKEYKFRQLENTKNWSTLNATKLREYRIAYKRKPKSDSQKRSARNCMLKRVYGISIDQYETMLITQNGKCALCYRLPAPNRSLHLDHDHSTGRIRALLCAECNWFLSKVDKDVNILVRIGMLITPNITHSEFIEISKDTF